MKDGGKTVMSPVWTAEREGCCGFCRFDKCRPQACYCQVSPGIGQGCLVNTHSELCMLVIFSSGIIGYKTFQSYTEYYAQRYVNVLVYTSTIQYIAILEPIYNKYFHVRR